MSRLALLLATAFAIGTFAYAEDKKDEKKDDDKLIKLVHVDSGKVLAIADDSDENEARVVLVKDEDKAGQHWKIVKDGEWLKIVHVKSGKVLDVNNASEDEDGEFIIWPEKSDDDGNDNQRFQWEGKGDERRLIAKHSKHALGAKDGNAVQKKSDEKAKDQLWKIVEVKAKAKAEDK